jgi:hypothetical protein
MTKPYASSHPVRSDNSDLLADIARGVCLGRQLATRRAGGSERGTTKPEFRSCRVRLSKAGRAEGGEDTQAGSFKVLFATWEPVVLALRLQPLAPAMAVCLEARNYCLRHERVARGTSK